MGAHRKCELNHQPWCHPSEAVAILLNATQRPLPQGATTLLPQQRLGVSPTWNRIPKVTARRRRATTTKHVPTRHGAARRVDHSSMSGIQHRPHWPKQRLTVDGRWNDSNVRTPIARPVTSTAAIATTSVTTPSIALSHDDAREEPGQGDNILSTSIRHRERAARWREDGEPEAVDHRNSCAASLQ